MGERERGAEGEETVGRWVCWKRRKVKKKKDCRRKNKLMRREKKN